MSGCYNDPKMEKQTGHGKSYGDQCDYNDFFGPGFHFIYKGTAIIYTYRPIVQDWTHYDPITNSDGLILVYSLQHILAKSNNSIGK